MRDSGELLRLVHQGMVNAGIDVDRIYHRLGYDARKLPLSALSDCRPRHELQKYFWQVVEGTTGDGDIGLHLCPHMPMFRAHVLEYLFLSSPTFGEGCRVTARYCRLVGDAFAARLVHDERGARIQLRGTTNDVPQLRHPEICYTYGLIRILQLVSEGVAWPQRVRLCCSRRSDRDEYEHLFDCPVDFDAPSNEIWFDPDILDVPSPHYDPQMLELHCEHAKAQLERLRQQDLIDDVCTCLRDALKTGEPTDNESLTLEQIADALDVSARRLRRDLAAAGTSFRDILKASRFRYARRMLRETDTCVETIACRIGFSEPSAFYRAFKNWSGLTPSEYRERRRNGQRRPLGPSDGALAVALGMGR